MGLRDSVLPEQFVKLAKSSSAIVGVAALNSVWVAPAVGVLKDFPGIDHTI